MPIITTQTDSGAATNYSFTANSIVLYVTQNAAILSDGNAAISVGTYVGDSIINRGTIGGTDGIDISNSPTSLTTIDNEAGGVIMGFDYAINIYNASSNGYNYITNSGTIFSNNVAIQDIAAFDTVDNYGVITGYFGFDIYGKSETITNSGYVHAQDIGIKIESSGSATIINTGELIGYVDAIDSPGMLTLHNSGNIVGAIDLTSSVANANTIDGTGGSISGAIIGGSGVDTFDLSHMTVVGTISGGLGNDIITGTAGNDLIYGDNVSGDTTGGNDTISGGYGDDTINGGYGNDTLYGNQGDDVLYGNQGNDWMHGGQGDDTLYGGQGDDTLNGGLGNDVLVGGLGNDTFKFDINFGHDTIADFSVVSGNSDIIDFAPGTFNSYADVSAHMAQSGNDVIITLDANNSIDLHNVTIAQLTADHFIFA